MSETSSNSHPLSTTFLNVGCGDGNDLWWPCAIFNSFSHFSKWYTAVKYPDADIRHIARLWFKALSADSAKANESLAIKLGVDRMDGNILIFSSDFGEQKLVSLTLGDLYVDCMNIPGWRGAVDSATLLDFQAFGAEDHPGFEHPSPPAMVQSKKGAKALEKRKAKTRNVIEATAPATRKDAGTRTECISSSSCIQGYEPAIVPPSTKVASLLTGSKSFAKKTPSNAYAIKAYKRYQRPNTKHVSSSKAVSQFSTSPSPQKKESTITLRSAIRVSPLVMASQESLTLTPSSGEECNDIIKIGCFRDIFKLLRKAGYCMLRGKYCNPGVTNPVLKEYVEGKDYFSTETDFRRNLCAYGVDCKGEEWLEHEIQQISSWIRYSIVVALRGKTEFTAVNQLLSNSQVHILLLKLGYKYGSNFYSEPGVTRRRCNGIDVSGAWRKDGPDGLWTRIARFGLPSTCDFSKISSDERMGLELYFCDSPSLDTFIRLEPTENDPIQSIRFSCNMSSALHGMNSTESSPQRSKVEDDVIVHPTNCAGKSVASATTVSMSTFGSSPMVPSVASCSVTSSPQKRSHLFRDGQNGDDIDNWKLPLNQHKDSIVVSSHKTTDLKLLVCPFETPKVHPGSACKNLFMSLASDEKQSVGTEANSHNNTDKLVDSNVQDNETIDRDEGPSISPPIFENAVEILGNVDKVGDDESRTGEYIELDEEKVEVNRSKMTGDEDSLDSASVVTQKLDESLLGARALADAVASGMIIEANLVRCGFVASSVDAARSAVTKEDDKSLLSLPTSPDADVMGMCAEAELIKLNCEGTIIEANLSRCGFAASSVDAATNEDDGSFLIVPASPDEDVMEKCIEAELINCEHESPDSAAIIENLCANTSGFTSRPIVFEPLTQEFHAGRSSSRTALMTQHEFPTFMEANKEDDITVPYVSKLLDDSGFVEIKKVDKFGRTPTNYTVIRPRSLELSTIKQTRKMNSASPEERPTKRACTFQRKADGKDRNVLPDQKETIKAMLLRCQKVLQTSYNVHKLSSSPSSKFPKQLEGVESFLRDFVASNGQKSGAMLYVSGASGVGKSSAVKYACKSIGETSGNVIFCNISGTQAKSRLNILGKLANTMSINSNATECKIQQALETGRGRRSEIRMVVMIIDEIDYLLSVSSGKGNKRARNESEEVLVTLTNWAKDPNLSFALIGISNSVGGPKARRIRDLGMVGENVVFGTYSKEDLIQIVIDRVGENVILDKVIEFAASKVAAAKGDVRLMLELNSKAIHKCLEAMPPSQQCSAGTDVPLVQMSHMMRAINSIKTADNFCDIIEGQPHLNKVVLCVCAVIMKQFGSSSFVMTAGKLHEWTRLVLGQMNPDDEFSLEMFRDAVSGLFDQGLLKSDDKRNLNNVSWIVGLDMPIRLGCQWQDVECALHESLAENKYYAGVLERARTMKLA